MQKTILKNNLVIILVITFLSFYSCDKKYVFDQYQQVGNSWDANQKITFFFTIKDTISKRNLFINLRNNNSYPYSNLFIITKMNFPDGKHVIDTLEYEMADKTGRLLGKGFTETKENKLFYKENITFPISGNYSVSVEQAMRKNGDINGLAHLDGITDVGFRIEKTHKE